MTRTGLAPKPLARHLLRARDLADARYAEPLSVADLAAAAGLSPPYFSRAFRQAFGESPHQYVLTRRLERAAALLRATDRSVASICFAVGWASVGSFSTSVRRIYGRTPAYYRAGFPGLTPSEAIRTALLGEVRHRRRSQELAAEVAALEADEADRKEMLAVAELMEALRASR